MRKIIVSLFLVFLPSEYALADKTTYPVSVQSCGDSITIDKHPERAVFHDINMTEMALALGIESDIVGVTGITGWYKMSPEFKKRLGNIPELAPKYPTLETLIAAKTDFFFAGWNYGMKIGGEVTPKTLKPYGIDTLVLSESCIHSSKQKTSASMALLFDDITKLGIIFDKQDKAESLINKWKIQIAKVKKRALGKRPPRVFLYDSGEAKPFTAGRYAMPNALIETAGGTNITSSMQTSWGRTSWEDIAQSDPEVIILLDYQSGGGAESLQKFLEGHPLMKHTEAVKKGRYVKLRYEQLTPGPANIGAIEKLSNAFFPQGTRLFDLQ